jgi:hypothetical protein
MKNNPARRLRAVPRVPTAAPDDRVRAPVFEGNCKMAESAHAYVRGSVITALMLECMIGGYKRASPHMPMGPPEVCQEPSRR